MDICGAANDSLFAKPLGHKGRLPAEGYRRQLDLSHPHKFEQPFGGYSFLVKQVTHDQPSALSSRESSAD
jgi:hypothetical protein